MGTDNMSEVEISNNKKFAGLKVINRDMLKYMAMFMMGVGHMIIYLGVKHFAGILPGWVMKFFVYGEFFAPPVFFFFISEGFRYTRSRKKYAIRLLVISLITQIPFFFCHYPDEPLWKILTSWNVMASLLAALLVLMVWDSKWKLYLRIIVMVVITGLTVLIQAEWMAFGPIMAFIFYLLREKPVLRFVIFEAVMLVWQFIMNGFYISFTLGAWGYFLAVSAAIIVITFFYNGKKGHFPTFSKWVFYVFYPAHLLAVILIRAFCF